MITPEQSSQIKNLISSSPTLAPMKSTPNPDDWYNNVKQGAYSANPPQPQQQMSSPSNPFQSQGVGNSIGVKGFGEVIPAPFKATGNEGNVKTALKTVGNTPTDAFNFGAGILDFLNPIKNITDIGKHLSDTITNVAQYASDTNQNPLSVIGKSLISGGEKPGQMPDIYKSALHVILPQFLQQIGSGDLQGAKKTLTEHPVTQVGPMVLIASGLAEKAGVGDEFNQMMTKIAKPISEPLGKAGEMGLDLAKKGITGGANMVKGAPELASKLALFGTAQSTGMSPKTITEIIRNPDNFSPEAMKQFTRENIAQEAIGNINSRIKDLSDTGKEYQTIRSDETPIKVKPNDLQKLISKNTGLKISAKGEIISSPAAEIRTPAEVAKVQQIYDRYQPLFESGKMTRSEFLNMRSDLAEMSSFAPTGFGSSVPLENLSEIMRGKLNTSYRGQIPGLEKLDTTYGAEKSQLDQIKKDYFKADGTLKDNAITKIANLSNTGRESVLGRLESVSPGITQKIITTKAVEDIANASGQKVGTYIRGGLVTGGAITGNITAIVAAIASSPEIATKILRGFGKMLNVKDAVIEKAVNEYDSIKSSIKENPEQGSIKNPFSQGEIPPTKFEGFNDLSTKLLEDLKGRDVVSKQYIEQRMISSDLNLKQVEKDLTKNVLNTFKGDKVPVQEFADKVKAELLPLEVKSSDTYKPTGTSYHDPNAMVEEGAYTPKYENISLPKELKGNIATYKEHIYQSPIKTSAGDVHFSGTGDNYFGHTRIEDMAGETSKLSEGVNNGSKMLRNPYGEHVMGKEGTTRRVIEVQSDLYQKGNLEREIPSYINPGDYLTGEQKTEYNRLNKRITDLTFAENSSQYKPEIAELTKKQDALEESAKVIRDKTIQSRKDELTKLQQYNDPTAHFRMVREEVKQAAVDGKTKLQFPTGETAMKIEGLGGQITTWREVYHNGEYKFTNGTSKLTQEKLSQGLLIRDSASQDWIITDVLGDGKFKAVPKSSVEAHLEDVARDFMPTSEQQQFDKLWAKNQTTLSSSEKIEIDRLFKQLDSIKESPKAVSEAIKRGGLSNSAETFDISGKVDTSNPIYKFYEKDLGRYLKTNYDAQLIKDKQGVQWWQLKITPDMKKAPVNAFGMIKGKDFA